jgi:hypothetical protein
MGITEGNATMHLKICVLMTVISCFLVESASAAVSVFDFSLPPGTPEQNVEGVAIASVTPASTITVTPTAGITGASDDLVDTIRSEWGLGVLNGHDLPDRSFLFNRVHVDGQSNNPAGGDEFITLSFSDKVQITKVVFAFVGIGSPDTFGLSIDGVDVDVAALFGTDNIAALAPSGSPPGVVLFPDAVGFGNEWTFYARGINDEWNIERVEVIPEPATAIIWSGMALGALAFYRRRRSKSAHPVFQEG